MIKVYAIIDLNDKCLNKIVLDLDVNPDFPINPEYTLLEDVDNEYDVGFTKLESIAEREVRRLEAEEKLATYLLAHQ